jgi:hypothetical protein
MLLVAAGCHGVVVVSLSGMACSPLAQTAQLARHGGCAGHHARQNAAGASNIHVELVSLLLSMLIGSVFRQVDSHGPSTPLRTV